MALFMVIGLITLNFTSFAENKGKNDHILGGPSVEARGDDVGAHTPGDSLGAAFAGVDVDNSGISSESLIKQGQNDFSVAVVRDIGKVAETLGTPPKATLTYQAKAGDTITTIAGNFGISIDTIIQANPELQSGSLKTGQKLAILPVSGILYSTKANDTIEGIASAYRIDSAKITEYNSIFLTTSTLAAGTRLILPGAKPKVPVVAALAGTKVKATLASTDGAASYFIQPAAGFNWGILHGHNGVDIANVVGTPVVAAADGLVVPDSVCQMDDGWNGGYGMCIMLKHPNGMSTLYAHLEKSFVELGDYVKQGQTIGLMGDTGKSTGPHVHFEVRGGTNPFVR